VSKLDHHRRQRHFAIRPIFAFFGEGIPYIGSSCHFARRYHALSHYPRSCSHNPCPCIPWILLRLDDRVLSSNVMNIPLARSMLPILGFPRAVRERIFACYGSMKTLFDSDRPHFAVWLRIYDIDRQPTPRRVLLQKPLYYAALCGFYDLVEHLIKKHSEDINAIGGNMTIR
jgi:hypothetical protein